MALNLDLLAELCMTPAVPGAEHRLRAMIEARAHGLYDETFTDPLGSLVLVRKPSKGLRGPAKKLLIMCHMDEIGFLVSYVDRDGFVFVQPVGGVDPRTLFSRRVLVCTESGDFKGVMNPVGKPLHLSSSKDREKIPEIADFFVDTGLGQLAREKISIGDFVVMDEPFLDLGTKCVSKALDNRIACWLGLELLRELKQKKVRHKCELYVAFTTQEEVGIRGARPVSFAVQPDLAIGVDTTLSCDLPGVAERNQITVQGNGFGLHLKDRSMLADRSFVKEIEQIASKHKILFQRTMLPAGGQDGAAAQQSAGGAKAASIVVGTRYIHTVTEMVDKKDLGAARQILIEIVRSN